MHIVDRVARLIDHGAFEPLWEPHTDLDVTRQKYMQSKALATATTVLRLAANEPNLRDALITYETNGWVALGVPAQEPVLAEAIAAKYIDWRRVMEIMS